MIVHVVERVWSVVLEPVVERDENFTEVLLRECVLVPDDQLEYAKRVCKGNVQGKVKCSVL